ncbi:MaoC family dehydratase N-terminal domain-containing protein [Nocardia sp. NPDC052278]|uniref:FAS1-like dehydratase domain-containing protein n=1 Tax=unclassified Nocardia TaxID=2637762 RepID=UPI0036A8BE19
MSTAVHPVSRLVGTVLLEFDMDIERGKIREFARATGSNSPVYLGERAPIPPTFLISSALWEPDDKPPLIEQLGLDLTRVLQGGQEFRFLGDLPRAGDHLQVDVSVESVASKAGKRGGEMTFVVLLTRYRDSASTVVAEARATIIERAQA